MVSKFSDVAVGLSEDRLGFRDYADGVIAIMGSISKEDTPFTIGIFGSWGSGKTSFMQIMRELLAHKGYKTIFFKSWEYGNEEMLWIPFMIKVVDELFKDEIDKKELIRNIFLFSTDLVLQTYTQGKISGGGILNVYKGSRKASPFKKWSNEDAKTVIERVTKIEEFKKRIEERAGESPNGKIIIFIDDLDRIPEKIVEFLNSLKTFLDIRGCIFVIGCDYKILDSALKQRYEGEIYEDYFDKIVQTEFYTPKISEQAIKNYLQFLTGWDANEIEECTQLVIHSIGGNPRKIKRVVNATMLIKSVLERRSATFLQAFERPEPRIRIERMVEVKKERGGIEVPITLKSEITKIFTHAEVFDLLFDKNKNVLFKLVCMREQWSTFYEGLLSDEEKQQGLISLQQKGVQQYISPTFLKYKSNLFGIEEQLYTFLNDNPQFQGVEDLKTYLTLLKISSPEAGISIEYKEPEKLSINLFNRYMLFERINKGKVDKRDIEGKINQMDWDKSKLCYYPLFTSIISALGYDNLLKGLFEKNQMKEKIKADPDPEATGRLLDSVRKIDKGIARRLLDKTKDSYTDKIEKSQDPEATRRLLDSVRKIDKKTARGLLNKTEPYTDKIEKSQDPDATAWLLDSVNEIDGEIATGLLDKTKDTYADKIEKSQDPDATAWLLNIVREMDKKAARGLLNETKNTYADKIIASTDLEGIGGLLTFVSRIDKKAARGLLNETKDTYADRIKDSTDPRTTGGLLITVREIDEETARELLNETKDTYADRIKDSTDPRTTGRLLKSVRWIDEETARELLKETKNTFAEKINTCTDLSEIGVLLRNVRWIDKKTARGLLKETKDTFTEKRRVLIDLDAIIDWDDRVREIGEKLAKRLKKATKNILLFYTKRF